MILYKLIDPESKSANCPASHSPKSIVQDPLELCLSPLFNLSATIYAEYVESWKKEDQKKLLFNLIWSQPLRKPNISFLFFNALLTLWKFFEKSLKNLHLNESGRLEHAYEMYSLIEAGKISFLRLMKNEQIAGLYLE